MNIWVTPEFRKSTWDETYSHVSFWKLWWDTSSNVRTRRTTGLLALLWRHNDPDGVSYHQPHDCLRNRLFVQGSKKKSKLRVTGLCVGNSPETGEFPAQMASNAENVSIWWRHHDWFRQCFIICLAPSYYLNQCYLILNWALTGCMKFRSEFTLFLW